MTQHTDHLLHRSGRSGPHHTRAVSQQRCSTAKPHPRHNNSSWMSPGQTSLSHSSSGCQGSTLAQQCAQITLGTNECNSFGAPTKAKPWWLGQQARQYLPHAEHQNTLEATPCPWTDAVTANGDSRSCHRVPQSLPSALVPCCGHQEDHAIEMKRACVTTTITTGQGYLRDTARLDGQRHHQLKV